ncbi:MAG: helix-turn-helix transcriptional regulator [Clostridia bacterium]|nr:helix-turn-helix transcriptional regulator [Clostridia bacterium]MBQ9600163.1 helix-turn-helix transcriptional regulator [Clostridia bacterium]MBR0028311.1 helix-turn-helix transcriptional regulator [Clostridia bacterium]MBR0089802.1 helix-turn-helix transcriptional regulator [Clostridia bacterium]MBR0469879.1 helix-turn-helix transcriptional regulator [Clostridia bacterium]
MALRLRDLREDNDYTQQYIADYLNFDQSDYSKYEREVRSIPLWALHKLADLYGTSIDYLTCRTDERKPYPKSKIKRE